MAKGSQGGATGSLAAYYLMVCVGVWCDGSNSRHKKARLDGGLWVVGCGAYAHLLPFLVAKAYTSPLSGSL